MPRRKCLLRPGLRPGRRSPGLGRKCRFLPEKCVADVAKMRHICHFGMIFSFWDGSGRRDGEEKAGFRDWSSPSVSADSTRVYDNTGRRDGEQNAACSPLS